MCQALRLMSKTDIYRSEQNRREILFSWGLNSRGEEVDNTKRIDMENRDCGANIQILIVTQKESK